MVHPQAGPERMLVAPASAQPKEGETDTDPAESPHAEYGSISGSILDENGPVKGHKMTFLDGDDIITGRGYAVTSDENGWYFIEKVPVGTWKVFYEGSAMNSFQALTPLGEVEVIANRVVVFDHILGGARVLSGHLTMPEMDGSLLILELRSTWEDRIIAKGTAATRLSSSNPPDSQPALPPGDDRVPPDGMDDGPPKIDRSGRFEMQGLEPGVYVLRVIMGRNKEGRQIFIETEVDLSVSDVELNREFTMVEFLQSEGWRKAATK